MPDMVQMLRTFLMLCFLSGAKAFNDEEEARKASKEARRHQNHDAGHLYDACGEGRDRNRAVASRASIVTEPVSKAVAVVQEISTTMPPPQTRNSNTRKGTPQPKRKPKTRKVMSHMLKDSLNPVLY